MEWAEGKADRLRLERRPSPLGREGRRRYLAGPEAYWAGAAAALESLGGGCKWPSGDPKSAAFAYCGAARVGPACCGRHAGLAYAPPTGRRSRPP